jgi:hypothetical protein
MKSLDQFDPLPKLGAKVQTEVVYYHQEEKEIKPFLYEKDGKLRYAPPEPAYRLETAQVDIDVCLEEMMRDAGEYAEIVYSKEPLPDLRKLVEEEKQDNKPTEIKQSGVIVTSGGTGYFKWI